MPCMQCRYAGERIDQTPLMYIVRDMEIVGSHFVFFSLSPGIAGYLAIYILCTSTHLSIAPFSPCLASALIVYAPAVLRARRLRSRSRYTR